MKTRFFILGAIFVILGFGAKAQVNIMYEHGFEENEPVTYSVTPTTGMVYSTDFYAGGARSIKLVQAKTEDVMFVTDTIDFRNNLTLRYISLEFDHICNVDANISSGGTDYQIGLIEVKLADEPDARYRRLTGSANYNTDRDEYSVEFRSTGAFNRQSYSDWSPNPTNANWKSERFDIDDMLNSSVPAENRRLMFRFVLKKRTMTGNVTGSGWWIDNLRIRASQNEMIEPKIKMALYPDGGAHPSSRGAKVVMDARTDVLQGINTDSAYLFYTIGSDLTPIRMQMAFVGDYTGRDNVVYKRFAARIPFHGYDTVMRFYCVVRDATANANMSRYPVATDSWVTYWCTRGKEFIPTTTPPVLVGTTQSANFPFIKYSDTRSEWVLDSALLRSAGYEAGAITSMRFTYAENVSAQTRPNFQFRMKNVPASYTVPSDDSQPFTKDYMEVVWDSTLAIVAATTGTDLVINFQDTFFYAGGDIVMQAINNGNVDPLGVKIKMITSPNNKKSKYFYGKSAGYQINAYEDDEMTASSFSENIRPAIVFAEQKNQPLLYDAGVASLMFPNYDSPIITQPSHIDVELKNFGALPFNSAVINYMIDSTTGSYRWNGTLAPGASTTVTVATGVTLTPGFHTLKAWTLDTLTAGGALYRDHEPYNNLSSKNNPGDTSFIVCAGPLNGVRNVGGDNADYGTIEEFLFSLSRCGINDSLVVRLAPGSYPPFVMPEVDGLTEQHYIVFEPATSNVTLYASAATGAQNIVDLTNVSNIRFRNINFVRRGGALANMVIMAEGGSNYRFDNCRFIDSLVASVASMRIGCMINSGYANNVTVDGCEFVGGEIGVDISGHAADLRSTGATVVNSLFSNQYTNGVRVQFVTNAMVEHNELYDVQSNSSYVMLVYACYGNVSVKANKIYTSHGAGALGLSGVNGSQANHAVVANNMIVCADDGNANLLTTPFNIIGGNWMDVVYNSVKMTAPQRSNIASATFGGGALNNSMFVNNIVACFDETNYALNFAAYNQTSNTIGHNVYYSEGVNLNRRGTQSYQNMEQWAAVVPMDGTSRSLDPSYLNGSLVDLRTFNRFIKGIGTPVPTVNTDMFDTVRDAQHPCPGAFEFVSLNYDFEVEALTSPSADVCAMPENVELVVRLRNSGSSTFVPNSTRTMTMSYQINGGSVNTYNITQTLPADDTVSIHTGRMLQLPANGLWDSVYRIRIWLTCANDPNGTNDSNTFTVVSRYQQPDATDYTQNVPYASATVVKPTTSLTEWSVYNDPNAPKRRSQVLWYNSPDDADYYYRGDSITTGVLRRDSVVYFKQRRMLPIVRITQVLLQKNNTVPGLTSPMPSWIKPTIAVAVQLTNVGDDTAYLSGDTLRTISTTTAMNNKIIKFGNNVKIAPGEFLVVQFAGGTYSGTGPTVYAQEIKQSQLADVPNLAIIYRHNGATEDAIAMNNETTAAAWTNQNVPSYVWTGGGISVTSSATGGLVRTAFNGTAADWRLATSASPVFIGGIDNKWIRYVDNGCPTGMAEAHLLMLNQPSVDVAVQVMPLPSGCSLGNEPVTVAVSNFGLQPAVNLTLNYAVGSTVVSETLTAPIPGGGDTMYTFLQRLNMNVPHDSVFNLTVYATKDANDNMNSNDTSYTSATALYSPGMPNMGTPVTALYGRQVTLSHMPADGIPVWYDSLGNALDTGYTYTTPMLYVNTAMQIGYLATQKAEGQIGTGTTKSGQKAYPSPYQNKNKFAKQQFIYSASELRSLGMQEGKIHSISFFLADVLSTLDSVVFDSMYAISLGLTDDTIFSNTTDWKSTSLVYSRQNFTIRRAEHLNNWIKHTLDSVFVWDGVSSLVVQVSFSKSQAMNNGGLQTYLTNKNNTTLHYVSDNYPTGGVLGFTGTGVKEKKRPNIIIEHTVYGCPGQRQTININLVGSPDYDAKLEWPEGTDSIAYNSCGNITMDVKISNLGSNPLNNFPIKYSLDGGDYVNYMVTNSIAAGSSLTTQFMSVPMRPGRHHVEMVVEVTGDTIPSNDTIRRDFIVSFCGTSYTISSDATADYHTIGEAVDSMNNVGIAGPVVFNIAGETFVEQVLLREVAGASTTNTISFVGESDSTTVLMAAPTTAANYVFKMDGASNVIVRNMLIVSRPPSGTNGNVLAVNNVDGLTMQNTTIRVKGTIANDKASCIVLDSAVSNLLIQDCWLDSGFYSVKGIQNGADFSNITFRNNRIFSFCSTAVSLKHVQGIEIFRNDIISDQATDSRGLLGIGLEDVSGDFSIQKNHIYLVDNKKGGKMGINLVDAVFNNQRQGYIVNNMISCYATNAKGITKPAGIYMKDCQYINVLYNSIRMEAGTIADSRALKVEKSNSGIADNILLMNNIIANFSSIAYEVTADVNMSSSDYNAYFSPEGANLAKWGAVACSTLADLQAANQKDGSSMQTEPYFMAIDDLHMTMTNLVGKAQYNPDVIDDIDDSIRSQVPSPTIGAQEMFRLTHNMSIVRVISPQMPTNFNFNTTTNMPPNIESDSVLVKVEFYNNGSTTENAATWYAYIEGYDSVTATPLRSLGSVPTGTLKIDSVNVYSPLGLIDTNLIRVVLNCPDDRDTADNKADKKFYLAPAFDIKTTLIHSSRDKCSLQQTQVSITLKNVGFKPIPSGIPLTIGLHADAFKTNYQPANKLSIRTMPDTVIETVTFDTPLPLDISRVLVFDSLVNFYPTDTAIDLKILLEGWCHFPYDIKPDNDSTKNNGNNISHSFESYYSPEPPVGYDTTFDYGTFGEVRASQVNGRPVRWYRDSTAAPFYSVTNYANSCWWRTTPQFFHDSTYYLQCFSAKNCPSYFSEVHVNVLPQLDNDLAIEGVVSPLGNRVYMENDTVRITISNYGSQPQQNFPVTYQIRKKASQAPLIQEVTEICSTLVDVGQTIVYTFDTLIQIPTPLADGVYYVRAWTDLANDESRRNDTLHLSNNMRTGTAKDTVLDYRFRTLKEGTYPACSNLVDPLSDSIDIVRISFNDIDVELPPMGRSYTNFGNNFPNPDYPVCHVTRGTSDSLIIAIANPSNLVDRDRGRVAAYIDFNRDGSFDDPGECIVSPTALYTDSLLRALVTIPQSASLGYMKMRVSASVYNYPMHYGTPGEWLAKLGHNVDFLLFVDQQPQPVDIALTQIVSPRDKLVYDSLPKNISFRMVNKGASPITSAHIYYTFADGEYVDTADFTWSGILQPGRSTVATLPPHVFQPGTSVLTIWHAVPGDTNRVNDTLRWEYHRFHTIFLTFDDKFDSVNTWYAPVGYNKYAQNFWQRGTPSKPGVSYFSNAYSQPNSWVTDLNSKISGSIGNVSYLYSPVIDISQIRPDTLFFYIAHNLSNGSKMHIEYYSYRRQWELLDDDSLLTWYNNTEDQCFTGDHAWYRRYISTRVLRGNFNERLQFRFVYTTPQKNSNTNFGGGCAIDNFRIVRGRNRIDAGIVAITKPEQPKYGQTLYPEVVVKNYGTDTIRQLQMGYTYYGTHLARMNTITCLLPPDELDTITFESPFTVTSDFPDTFALTAFTNLTSTDIYRDNDTLSRIYTLSPLGGDIALSSFIYPHERVVGGDSITVTVGVRNMGLAPISNATLSYTVGNNRFDEEVDVVELLGHPLVTRETLNYTFHAKFRASMGVMNLTAFAKCDSNEYLYNDTVRLRVNGISAITDVAATSMVVDTSDYNYVRFQLVVENRGARGVNNFEVGFWYDNDTTTKVVETFYRAAPLTALSMTTHLFDVALPQRQAGYHTVTGYVHSVEDNDRTNDTTTVIARQFVDIEVLGILVEENANPDCRVFMRVRNLGNLALVGKTLPLRATINGNDISYNVVRRLDPGAVTLIEFNRTIPKSPMRHYTGSGRIQNLAADINPDNNQTTNVIVVNYVEGIPTVNGNQFILGQNYPNPFSGTTTVPFTLPAASDVSLFVMDAMGKIVYTDGGFYPEGDNTFVLDLGSFATGVYYYGIVVDGQRQMRKLIVK